MRLSRSVLTGIAACLAGAGAVQAVELPTSQAAPMQYARICDAFGAAFFFVPGSNNCLEPEWTGRSAILRFGPISYRVEGANLYGLGSPRQMMACSSGPREFTSGAERGRVVSDVLLRQELDDRKAMPWGLSRSLPTIDAFQNSGGMASAGGGDRKATASSLRTTFVDEAFLRFAGLTAGDTQFIDFDADPYSCSCLSGRNVTIGLMSYTATFGDGFSTSISFGEKAVRGATVLGTIASVPEAAPISINGISAPSFRGSPGEPKVPDLVGANRPVQQWGSVRLDAAAHRVQAGLFANRALVDPSLAFPVPRLTANSTGLTLPGGVQPNMDYLSPGDRLWLQAAYENGAYGTLAGANLVSTSIAADKNRLGGVALAPVDTTYGWSRQADTACPWTANVTCDHQSGQDNVPDTSRRYWLPTFSSAVFGPYQDVRYSSAALAGFGGAVGISNIETIGTAGPSFIGMPLTGFAIGAEFMYIDVKQARPVVVVPDLGPTGSSTAGVPTIKSSPNEYLGRLRVQPAF